MNEVEVICLICPLACKIRMLIDDNGNIQKVVSAECKKGKDYAIKEYTSPERILTATVRTKQKSHPLLSVRTAQPIPKKYLHQCMRILANVEVSPPVRMGDTIVINILDTGVDIVATQELIE